MTERPDRWFYIGECDLEPAEVTPVWRWLDRLWFELMPPPGWTRVVYEPQPWSFVVHANGGSPFALDELLRRLDAEERLT